MRKKIFAKFLKENKGMTLVELICGLAIMASITAVMSGIMIISANNYDRGTSETTMQQEAQLTANGINSLIVDSTRSVKYFCYDAGAPVEILSDAVAVGSNPDRMLCIYNDDRTYEIKYQGSNLTYSEKDGSGNYLVADALFAENLTGFRVDVSDFEENRAVHLEMDLEVRNRHYSGSYNITSRNGEAKLVDDLGLNSGTATLVAPSQITLEPYQEYEFNYNVLGRTDYDVELEVPDALSTQVVVSISGVNKIKVVAAGNAVGDSNGNIPLLVKVCEQGTDNELDSRTVNIHIRRVTGMTLNEEPAGKNKFNAGQSYVIRANITGNFLARVPGADYDLTDYVDPYQVAWSTKLYIMDLNLNYYEASESVKNEYIELVTLPSNECVTQLKLKKNVPKGCKIVVHAIAKHPAGTIGGVLYNKTGNAYADIQTDWELEREQTVVWKNDGFIRGNDTILFESTLNPQGIKDTYGGEFCWLYRFKETKSNPADETWSSFYLMREGGTQKKINADESKIFLPDKEYDCQIIGVAANIYTKTLYWPHDEGLLSLPEFAGWHKGWAGSDTTMPGDYGGHFHIDKVHITFTYNSVGLPNTNKKTVGPVSLYGSEFWVNIDASNLEYSHYQNTFKGHVQKDMGVGNWQDHAVEGFSLNTGATFRIDNYPSARGRYRIGVKMENAGFKQISGDLLNPQYNDIPGGYSVDLGDPFSEEQEGIIYVNFFE